MAIDVGIVLVSITIFDRKNKIFPNKIKETGKAKSLLTDSSYFDIEQSFYSAEHGGTFHFAHFNVHFFKSFLESNAFKSIMELVDENIEETGTLTKSLINKLSALKMLYEDPISPNRSRGNSLYAKPQKLEETEEEDKIEEEIKGEDEETPTAGGGFPSLAHLEKIKEKYGVVKDLNGLQLLWTGGYNNNFLELIAWLLNVKIYIIHGYMETILSAISFLNTNSNDCFYSLPNKDFKNIYELGNLKSDPKEQIYFSIKDDLYPYLLVNLRSGANFIRVNSKNDFKRVIGTSIGAGTFVGISKLLWEGNDLTAALFAGLKGDSRNIDMSVGDIYGKNYSKIGLPAQVIASSFGKIKDKTPDEIQELKKEDVSLSLLNMIIFNTLTIASLVAKIEKIDKVVVIGHHLRILELEQLFEMGYSFLSKNESKIMFLKYSSYLGSLGLLIDHADLDTL